MSHTGEISARFTCWWRGNRDIAIVADGAVFHICALVMMCVLNDGGKKEMTLPALFISCFLCCLIIT